MGCEKVRVDGVDPNRLILHLGLIVGVRDDADFSSDKILYGDRPEARSTRQRVGHLST